MRYANFRLRGYHNNDCFSSVSRDHSNTPFVMLRDTLKRQGIELNTPDVNQDREVEFEIHVDFHQSPKGTKKFLLLWEPNHVRPRNFSQLLTAGYDEIFSWDDELVEKYGFKKFFLPVYLPPLGTQRPFESRSLFCCLIAGNKTGRCASPADLYKERQRTIRWFEGNKSNQFDLYGGGWDKRGASPGVIGRLSSDLSKYIYKLTGMKAFPSYRGTVASKQDILGDYRYTICYENSKAAGYISEKIFDAFFAGCVPVYWGATNIEAYIPQSCFIDRRLFEDNNDLYQYMASITPVEYGRFQESIKSFLMSESANRFYPQNFVSTCLRCIN